MCRWHLEDHARRQRQYRERLRRKFGTCHALVRKFGTCHDCNELAELSDSRTSLPYCRQCYELDGLESWVEWGNRMKIMQMLGR